MRRLILLFMLCLSPELFPAETVGRFGAELHVRSGLPTTADRAAQSGEFRVAYLGGSITAAEGWRPLTTAHLRRVFPRVAITEIAAGLPGTGSDLGACRLYTDVLRHRADLLFIEFAVNDATTPPAEIEHAMEGIVRQTWRSNPATDICFVYTVSTPGWSDVVAGNFPASAKAMENVAAHYDIPTVHLGFEVAWQVARGKLIFKGVPSDGDRAFSLDGVHPTAAGHRVYADVLQQALPELLKKTTPRSALPAPLYADNWERAEQRALSPPMFRGTWAQVAPDDPALRGATKVLLPPTWRTETPGAAVEFEFTGTRLGLLGIAAPDSGEFVVTVDDRAPIADTFFDAHVTPTFCRARKWFYPHELAPGVHRVRVELSARPVDKIAIKEAAGKSLDIPSSYSANKLALSGLLLIDTAP